MKRTQLILFTLLAASAGVAQAALPADAITGVWLDSSKEGYIQIYETEEGVYAAQIVGATDGKVRDDSENPDPSERDESLLGQRIAHGFSWNGEGRYENGRIYDPDNGKTYDAWMDLSSRDQLEVHGYIFISLIGRSETWTRVGPELPENVVKSALYKPEEMGAAAGDPRGE